jgi:hypothetical protein
MIFSEKPLHTPHQVRGRLFPDLALGCRQRDVLIENQISKLATS